MKLALDPQMYYSTSTVYELPDQVARLGHRPQLGYLGGRAVTVMSFFALAWLVISGRIEGPEGDLRRGQK